MKIFISQPMKGKSDEEIIAEREWAKARFQRHVAEGRINRTNESIEVINSFFQGADEKPLACLGRALMLMSEADYVVFTPGWKEARGCVIEHLCCREYCLSFLELVP